jgi:hypothetical protein
MTFSGHAAVTVLTLSVVKDPTVLVASNFALHYATDAIPHAEFFFLKSNIGKALTILIDTSITFLLIWLSLSHFSQGALVILLSFFAAFLPDFIDFLTRRFAKPIRHFHLFAHTWPVMPKEVINWEKTMTGKTPTWVKLGIQLLLILAALRQLS